MDKPTADGSTLALFDFDGTLVELATDYVGLGDELDVLDPIRGHQRSSGLLHRLLRLYAAPDVAGQVSAAVDQAEIRGLEVGRPVHRGVSLYRHFAECAATIAVVTHNGRAVVDAFFAASALRPPDAVFDLHALAAPKQESGAIRDFVARARPSRTYVVGNDKSDRALAQALSADYVDVHES